MKAILANQCRIAIKLHVFPLLWAVNRIWKQKMGALRFAKKTTNNVAQHVQWMRSGPSCPSDTDEQADEKPHTSIFEFWSPESWLLDD